MATAQTGCFTFTTDSIGCAPMDVQFANCFTPGQPVAYNFNFIARPNATGFATVANPRGDTAFRYNAPGIFEVRQVASGGSINRAARRTVKVFAPNSKPIFRLVSCPNQVRVQIQDSIFRQCLVEVQGQSRIVNIPLGGAIVDFPLTLQVAERVEVKITGTSPSGCGNTQVIDSVTVYPVLPPLRLGSVLANNATSLTVTYPVLRDIGYRLFLRSLIPSGLTTLVESTHLSSSQILTSTYTVPPLSKYSIVIEQGMGCQNRQVDSLPALNPRRGVEAYTIAFDNLASSLGQLTIEQTNGLIQSLSNTDTLYKDTLRFKCNEERCYFLKIGDTDRSFTSYPICLKNAEGSSQELVLLASAWDNVTSKHILRFSNGLSVSGFIGDGFETLTTFPPVVRLQTSNCLPIGFVDSCGNTRSEDPLYCPLVLSGRIQRDVRFLTISPAQGVGYEESIRYILRVTSPSGQELAAYPIQDLSFRDQSKFTTQRLVYQAIGIPVNNLRDTSYSNTVTLVRDAEVILPEAFSPNGDGLNDSLTASTKFIQEASITIFDVWGTAVYKSPLPFCWAGVTKSGKAQPGSYVALIQAKTEEGETIVRRKWVTLVP